MKSTETLPHGSDHTETEAGVKKMLDALRGLKFGSVEITVHEGRIVQIERREKQRLNIHLKDHDNGGNT